MTNNAQKISEELLEVTEGLSNVPSAPLPPRIKWGEQFLAWPDDKKLQYLMKFAEGMNHAAATIQGERDELDRLCALKEKQLEQMKETVDTHNMMLVSEITKMNEQRQDYNAHVAKLNARIRELENGNPG